MAKTISQLKPGERSAYHLRSALERRKVSAGDGIRTRWDEAQRLARDAAGMLKQKYSASRVVMFGSATRIATFTPWSDVDLAVWGVPPERFYAAVAAVTGLCAGIGIDLIDAGHCGETLLAAIERDGVEL